MVAHWLAELDGRKVAVEVPASSANLGAGYDCLGVALALTNKVELEVRGWSRGEIELTVDGEGHGELSQDRDNCFVKGLEAALEAARGELPAGVGWRIVMHNRIPLARGLGSSAAATVAGIVAGNALLGDPLSKEEMLGLACEIEGHPDNAAAALLGGFVGQCQDGRRRGGGPVRCPARPARGPLHPGAAPADRRRCARPCPAKVPLVDAVANIGAVGSGVAGLATGRHDLLRYLTVDRLHEPYRASVYPQLPRLIEAAREAGALGACLSGAGSTILAFADSMNGIIADRGRLRRGRRRHRPARRGHGGGAAEQGREGRLADLTSQSSVTVRSRTKPMASPQAEALASANSAALRSKKLCGAPGYVTRRWSVPAAVRAASNASMASAVIAGSAPPNSPRTGEAIEAATSTGAGASFRHGPTSVP